MYELIMGLNNKYFFVTLPNLNYKQSDPINDLGLLIAAAMAVVVVVSGKMYFNQKDII